MSIMNRQAVKARAPRSSRVRPRKLTVAADAQSQILQAVDELFYEEGARAVGVEAVVQRAGVNKMALYRQFESKDALLLHYLQRMDEKFWGYFDHSVAQHPGQPRAQLAQFFTDLAERAMRPGYRGCPFVNIAAEFPDRDHPTRRLVAANKARLLERLLELAKQSQVRDPRAVAQSLALLVEGAYAASQTFSPPGSVLSALAATARQIVESG
jgi:AcrR family transcriptional regulator